MREPCQDGCLVLIVGDELSGLFGVGCEQGGAVGVGGHCSLGKADQGLASGSR